MTNSLKLNNSAWNTTLCFMFAVVAVMLPDLASAIVPVPGDDSGDTPGTAAISDVICNIVAALQGPVARGVAAFGIIFLGFSLFLGKISWGTALALGIGLGAIFGAEAIVGLMAPDGTQACEA